MSYPVRRNELSTGVFEMSQARVNTIIMAIVATVTIVVSSAESVAAKRQPAKDDLTRQTFASFRKLI